MRHRADRLTCVLCLSIFGLAGAPVARGQEQNRENVHLEGVIEEMAIGGILRVADTQGTTWLVKIEAQPMNISYSGTAEPDWLMPGMWVRFRTSLNQKLLPDGPVPELTVFSPQDRTQIGIFPEMTLGKELFGDPDPQAQPMKDKPVPCIVAGQLTQVRRNKLTVAAGNAAISIEVPPSVKVGVELPDLRLAARGDKISLDGWKYVMVPGRAIAERVAVTGASPLRGPKSRPPRNTPPKDKPEEKPSAKP